MLPFIFIHLLDINNAFYLSSRRRIILSLYEFSNPKIYKKKNFLLFSHNFYSISCPGKIVKSLPFHKIINTNKKPTQQNKIYHLFNMSPLLIYHFTFFFLFFDRKVKTNVNVSKTPYPYYMSYVRLVYK